MQLMKEKLDLFLDPIVWIFKELANVNNFTLELQHIVQDQMSDDHEALLANMNLSVMQKHKDILDSLVQQIWETVEKVSQSDDDVSLNAEFNI